MSVCETPGDHDPASKDAEHAPPKEITAERIAQVCAAIGTKAKTKRAALQRTLQEVGDGASVSGNFVWAIEHGAPAKLETYIGLADALNMKLSALMGAADALLIEDGLQPVDVSAVKSPEERLGGEIKALATRRGMNMETLASIAGISHVSMCAIVRGERAKPYTYYRIACALKVPVSRLMRHFNDGVGESAEKEDVSS